MKTVPELLDAAFAAREAFFDPEHVSAFRLFNGFLEGFPALSLDVYARSVLLHNYAENPSEWQPNAAQDWIREKLPWVQCIISKTRHAQTDREKRGLVVYGALPDSQVREEGTWYAIDLSMNRDASLYLDTRNLRSWARKNLGGKTVLNTFAYTGSLGLAALAGGAAQAVQLDRNRACLDLAKASYRLNGYPVTKKGFIVDDFFPAVSRLKRAGQTFDCVFLDPPFFSSTAKGTVDLETGSTKLINKVRPLINDGGWLVAINNALFVSGKDYLASLETLCADGYLAIEELIPVLQDFTGFAQTRVGNPPVDPAPFNHSTKIAVLRIKRKPASSIQQKNQFDFHENII